MQGDGHTNLQTYTQTFSQYSGISSHFLGRYKTKGTLLQELQPKYDSSWMGYWTGKILTSCHSKFRFGIYCLFLRLSWRKMSRYFAFEKFVCFHLWEEYDLMHCKKFVCFHLWEEYDLMHCQDFSTGKKLNSLWISIFYIHRVMNI